MRYLIVVIAVVGWLTVTTSVVQACSCITPGTPCESYGTASAVFVGTAVSVREMERPKPGDKAAWYHQRALGEGANHLIAAQGANKDCAY